MRKKYYSYASLLSLFFMVYASCQSPSGTTNEEKNLSHAMIGMPMNGDCEVYCKRDEKSPFSISEKCAECIQENYRNHDYSFPEFAGKKVRGFEVQQKELKDILNAIGPDTTARVFALLAIGDSLTHESQAHVQVPELVFVVEKIDNSTKGQSFTYYDFTRPCPNYCPDEQ